MRVLIALFLLIGFIIAMMVGIYYRAMKRHMEEMRQAADVEIYMDEPLHNLQRVEMNFCDSIHVFTVSELKDTVRDRLSLSTEHFPCFVGLTYYFYDGTLQRFSADSFNCAGCSGINRLVLYGDSVAFQNRP